MPHVFDIERFQNVITTACVRRIRDDSLGRLDPLSPQFFCVPIEEPHMYVCIHIYVQAEETVAIPARNLTKRIVHGFFEADNSAAAPQRAYGTIVSWPGPQLK